MVGGCGSKRESQTSCGDHIAAGGSPQSQLDSVLQEWGTAGRFQLEEGLGEGRQVEAQPELSRRELTEARTRVAAEEASGVDRSELPGRWGPQGRPWMRPRWGVLLAECRSLEGKRLGGGGRER